MNAAQIREWVFRSLGGGFLTVEITEDQLSDALEDSLRWFSAQKGVERRAVIPVTAGRVAYDLPDDCDAVYDVVFSLPPFDLTLIFSPFILIDEKVPYDVFAAPQSQGLYSTFTQTLQYVEMAKRVIGAESDWRREDNQIVLSPAPRNAGWIVVEYKSNDFQVERLCEIDHDLVKRFALARAKIRCGRNRSKYDTYAVAGGFVNLDGERLLDEGEKETEELQRLIHSTQMPMRIAVM
jgi:hypothetical protein